MLTTATVGSYEVSAGEGYAASYCQLVQLVRYFVRQSTVAL